MTLTAGQLRFVRDHSVFEVLETAITQGIAQADVEFALDIKKVMFLEQLSSKKMS